MTQKKTRGTNEDHNQEATHKDPNICACWLVEIGNGDRIRDGSFILFKQPNKNGHVLGQVNEVQHDIHNQKTTLMVTEFEIGEIQQPYGFPEIVKDKIVIL